MKYEENKYEKYEMNNYEIEYFDKKILQYIKLENIIQNQKYESAMLELEKEESLGKLIFGKRVALLKNFDYVLVPLHIKQYYNLDGNFKLKTNQTHLYDGNKKLRNYYNEKKNGVKTSSQPHKFRYQNNDISTVGIYDVKLDIYYVLVSSSTNQAKPTGKITERTLMYYNSGIRFVSFKNINNENAPVIIYNINFTKANLKFLIVNYALGDEVLVSSCKTPELYCTTFDHLIDKMQFDKIMYNKKINIMMLDNHYQSTVKVITDTKYDKILFNIIIMKIINEDKNVKDLINQLYQYGLSKFNKELHVTILD